MKGPHPQSHVTDRSSGHVTNQRRYIQTFTSPMDPKLSRVVTQNEGTPSTSHVTHQPRSHVTNQRRYISTFSRQMDPKLSRVVTQYEVTPLTKSRNRSIKWSRNKSKLFCLYFHKAQGLQTQQGGNQNEKIPPNISCDTLITPSRDNFPVAGSVYLFHFQLKLSPKSKQISNDYDNTENVQLA